MEVAQWRAENLAKCVTCKDIYAMREPSQEPPCGDCRPAMHESNEDAFLIFGLVQNQFIMGPSGPVDINHLAVWEAIDRLHVQNGPKVFLKVLDLSRWTIERINEKQDRSPSK